MKKSFGIRLRFVANLLLTLTLTLFTADLALNLSSSARAEDQQPESGSRLNEEFYPYNYARNPLDSVNPKNAPQASNSSPKQAKSDSGQSIPAKADLGPSLHEPKGVAIESISLIMSGLEAEPIKKAAEVLLRLYNEKSIRTSTIYFIGDSAEQPAEEIKVLLRRLSMNGVIFSITDAPPSNFHVTKGPSWIITTKQGDTVLEGLNSPEKLINSKGEFITPEDLEELGGS